MAQGVANLSQDERMQEVLRMLETRDSVHVSELAKTFAVSEVTVRSDLSALARQGLVARVRGGVRPLQGLFRRLVEARELRVMVADPGGDLGHLGIYGADLFADVLLGGAAAQAHHAQNHRPRDKHF